MTGKEHTTKFRCCTITEYEDGDIFSLDLPGRMPKAYSHSIIKKFLNGELVIDLGRSNNMLGFEWLPGKLEVQKKRKFMANVKTK